MTRWMCLPALLAAALLTACMSERVVVVTATPAPTVPPTAAAALPPTSALPSLPPQLPTAVPTSPSVPPRPTATPVLPQITLLDSAGNIDVAVFGSAIAKTNLVFRVVACVPDCKEKPDGFDVRWVKFFFFKKTPRGTLQYLYEHEDTSPPYCAFGDREHCDFWDIASPNAKWPNTQAVIEDGDYVLTIQAEGKRSTHCTATVNFKVQR